LRGFFYFYSMIRNILSIIVGLLIAIVVMQLIQILGHLMYPPPIDIDVTDPEAIKHYITLSPTIVFVIVILSYALGSFFGAFVSTFIAKEKHIPHAINIGGVLMGLGAINLFTIPHPTWMIVISLIVFLPFAYFGGWLGLRIKAKRHSKNTSH